jgi:hypothetical protein
MRGGCAFIDARHPINSQRMRDPSDAWRSHRVIGLETIALV